MAQSAGVSYSDSRIGKVYVLYRAIRLSFSCVGVIIIIKVLLRSSWSQRDIKFAIKIPRLKYTYLLFWLSAPKWILASDIEIRNLSRLMYILRYIVYAVVLLRATYRQKLTTSYHF